MDCDRCIFFTHHWREDPCDRTCECMLGYDHFCPGECDICYPRKKPAPDDCPFAKGKSVHVFLLEEGDMDWQEVD